MLPFNCILIHKYFYQNITVYFISKITTGTSALIVEALKFCHSIFMGFYDFENKGQAFPNRIVFLLKTQLLCEVEKAACFFSLHLY
jgi:hypothetical protein